MENTVTESFTVLRCFPESKTFYKSIHSLSSFSSLFSILKTIFQVQVRKTLEHNRVCLDIVQVLQDAGTQWNLCMYIV